MSAFNITLYSTDCPKCQILKKKLAKCGAKYDLISDIEVMKEKGFKSAPMLEVNGEIMEYGAAVKWVNQYNKNQVDDHNLWTGMHNEI